MPWTSLTPLLVWAILFVPLTYVLLSTQIKDRLTPVLLFLSYLSVNLFFFLVVNWSLFNYYLRFLPLIILFGYTIRFFMSRLKHKPWLLPWTPFYTALRVGALVVLAAFGVLNFLAIRSYDYPTESKVMVQYPAQTGMYVVVNGGNGIDGWWMSDSYRDWLGRPVTATPWQAYAIDVMELRTNGMVADTVLNTDVNKYEGSINESLRSPCPGIVVFKDFNHTDVRPYDPPAHPLGNRVVIQCANSEYFVTISNLKQTFDLLEVGQFVSFNTIIGYIGTSGTPSVPHVHMFANLGGYDESAPPLPIEFEGAFAVRNKLYIR